MVRYTGETMIHFEFELQILCFHPFGKNKNIQKHLVSLGKDPTVVPHLLISE